jgi:ComF family protein
LLAAVTDLIYPPQCAFCGELLPSGGPVLLCAACRQELADDVVRCGTCAAPAPRIDSADGKCPRCRAERPAFQAARVLGAYQARVRECVLKIKHTRHEPLAAAVGRLLADRIAQWPLPTRPDLVTPVPMHWLRRLWRGTNAAATLAEALAGQLGIPLADDLVYCRRLTQRQSLLSGSQRWENVRGAYGISSAYDIRGATILVVDDVLTTTATCDAVARQLRHAGAKQVFAAAVARAAWT